MKVPYQRSNWSCKQKTEHTLCFWRTSAWDTAVEREYLVYKHCQVNLLPTLLDACGTWAAGVNPDDACDMTDSRDTVRLLKQYCFCSIHRITRITSQQDQRHTLLHDLQSTLTSNNTNPEVQELSRRKHQTKISHQLKIFGKILFITVVYFILCFLYKCSFDEEYFIVNSTSTNANTNCNSRIWKKPNIIQLP